MKLMLRIIVAFLVLATYPVISYAARPKPKPLRLAGPPTPQTVVEAMVLANKTLDYVAFARPVPELAAQLRELGKEATGAKQDDAELIGRIKQLRRKIIFRHPALDFKKLLINKTPPTLYSHNCDQYLGRHSQTGPGLVVLEDWKSAKPKETVLLADKMPPGAYNKQKLHWEGQKIIFAFCDHSVQGKERRRYFIWECAADGSSVRQLTGTKKDSFERWGDRYTAIIEDNDPAYVPDGGIVFVSTRCQGFGRCHNGRYTPSLLLYRADGDGSRIRQLSWGEANEADPVVLSDGRIAYTRWEYINRNVTKFHMLWWTRPDGTASNNFYGNATEAPWMLSETAPIPGSDKFLALATGHHTYSTGCIVRIDPTIGEDYDKPLVRVTPEVSWFEAERMKGSGCYSTPWPLNEELYLASYSRHRVPGQGGHKINDYAIYLVDTFGGRELIYRDPTVSCFSPTPMTQRPVPRRLSNSVPEKATSDTGTLTLQNVAISRNDPQQKIAPGTVKSIRINEIINQPAVLKNGGAQPSLVRHDTPKKILGTVPVYEDGSASFEVPARVPIQLQALDKDGMAVMTMRSFIYLQPGERRACIGCHEPPGTPPTRNMTIAARRPAEKIVPSPTCDYEDGFSYPRTVQPVLDRYCIGCHGLSDDPKVNGGLDLTGIQEMSVIPKGLMKSSPGRVPRSYNQLMARYEKLLAIAIFKAETNSSEPRDYFASASQLTAMLQKGHGGVHLDRGAMLPLVQWMDLNCQVYGNFSWNRIENSTPDPEGEQKLRNFLRKRFGEKIASQPFATLVNVGQMDASRALLAPLPESEGGWGQWTGAFASRNDAQWKELLQLVKGSIAPLKNHDVAGTCNQPRCRCKSCWVRQAEEEFQAGLKEVKK